MPIDESFFANPSSEYIELKYEKARNYTSRSSSNIQDAYSVTSLVDTEKDEISSTRSFDVAETDSTDSTHHNSEPSSPSPKLLCALKTSCCLTPVCDFDKSLYETSATSPVSASASSESSSCSYATELTGSSFEQYYMFDMIDQKHSSENRPQGFVSSEVDSGEDIFTDLDCITKFLQHQHQPFTHATTTPRGAGEPFTPLDQLNCAIESHMLTVAHQMKPWVEEWLVLSQQVKRALELSDLDVYISRYQELAKFPQSFLEYQHEAIKKQLSEKLQSAKTIQEVMLDAVSKGDGKLVTYLIQEREYNVNTPGKEGDTLLHVAAKKGRVSMVVLLLKHGAHMDARNDFGWTPLHDAVFGCKFGVFIQLVERGACVSAQALDGITPLHCAAFVGQTSMAKILIDRHVDVSAQNKRGWTPLVFAIRRGHSLIADYLKEHGA